MPMKRYTGTKTLAATPMTRGEYNAYRGWTAPEGEPQDVAGYLVEYEDGGKANDSRHAGYISWSPADVFERSYRELPAMSPTLLPHQQRVVVEHADLDDRLKKLQAFLPTDTFATLDADEQERLHAQVAAMCDYSNVLSERIDAFTA